MQMPHWIVEFFDQAQLARHDLFALTLAAIWRRHVRWRAGSIDRFRTHCARRNLGASLFQISKNGSKALSLMSYVTVS